VQFYINTPRRSGISCNVIVADIYEYITVHDQSLKLTIDKENQKLVYDHITVHDQSLKLTIDKENQKLVVSVVFKFVADSKPFN
jgi:cell division protein FtsI/penicillin-binding protein 2